MELTVLPICGKNSACLTVKAVVKKFTLSTCLIQKQPKRAPLTYSFVK